MELLKMKMSLLVLCCFNFKESVSRSSRLLERMPEMPEIVRSMKDLQNSFELLTQKLKEKSYDSKEIDDANEPAFRSVPFRSAFRSADSSEEMNEDKKKSEIQTKLKEI